MGEAAKIVAEAALGYLVEKGIDFVGGLFGNKDESEHEPVEYKTESYETNQTTEQVLSDLNAQGDIVIENPIVIDGQVNNSTINVGMQPATTAAVESANQSNVEIPEATVTESENTEPEVVEAEIVEPETIVEGAEQSQGEGGIQIGEINITIEGDINQTNYPQLNNVPEINNSEIMEIINKILQGVENMNPTVGMLDNPYNPSFLPLAEPLAYSIMPNQLIKPEVSQAVQMPCKMAAHC